MDSFAETGAGRLEFPPIDDDGCLVAGDAHADLMPFARSCMVFVTDDPSLLLRPGAAVIGDQGQVVGSTFRAGTTVNDDLQQMSSFSLVGSIENEWSRTSGLSSSDDVEILPR